MDVNGKVVQQNFLRNAKKINEHSAGQQASTIIKRRVLRQKELGNREAEMRTSIRLYCLSARACGSSAVTIPRLHERGTNGRLNIPPNLQSPSLQYCSKSRDQWLLDARTNKIISRIQTMRIGFEAVVKGQC